MAACIDLDFQRGNNVPLIWQFLVSEGPDVLFDLTGSEFVLTIAFRGGQIRKDSAVDSDFGIDLSTSTVAWTPALLEGRQIPCGKLARYELERRIAGAQRTLVSGAITGRGGIGDD